MPPSWDATIILGELRQLCTNSLVVVVDTDQGQGYLKAVHANGNPHDLVCELVGTELARYLGIPTFDYALIGVPDPAPFRLHGGPKISPGFGYITRSSPGDQWGGQRSQLQRVENRHDFGRMVALDTWTLNCDRYRPAAEGRSARVNYRNVYLERQDNPSRQLTLVAIDHGHCFKCDNDLTPGYLASRIGDRELYGLFPEFVTLARKDDALVAADRAANLREVELSAILDLVPKDWHFSHASRDALAAMMLERAKSLRSILEESSPKSELYDAEQVREGE